jgi:hypothetical protein
MKFRRKLLHGPSTPLPLGRSTFNVGLVPSPRSVCSRLHYRKLCWHSSQGSSAYFDGNRCGARPIFHQRSSTISSHDGRLIIAGSASPSSSLLSPYDLRGTSNVLSPKWMHLSPCLGAALSASPMLGNLIRLGRHRGWEGRPKDEGDSDYDAFHATQLAQTSFLATSLFFQMIRESPIHLVRNRSMPASYLTPSMVGSFLAYSLAPGTSSSTVRKALRDDFGIKSNYIDETFWTGISLARWMDLVVDGQGSTTKQVRYSAQLQVTLVPSLWLIALWSVASTKDDLIEYFRALDQGLLRVNRCDEKDGQRFLGAKHHDVGDLLSSSIPFTDADFDNSRLEDAMDRLIHYYRNRITSSVGGNVEDFNGDYFHVASALELICASIVLQQDPFRPPRRGYANEGGTRRPPGAIPNGVYNFDGSDYRADCVEVVIREIVRLLLWDPVAGSWDLRRLPQTASPRLIELLLMEQRILEPENQSDNDKACSTDDREREIGQGWFDMLSNLPGCDYLSRSPGGKSFELAPTIESISKALWHLLVMGRSPTFNAGSSLTENKRMQEQRQKPWITLYDLASFLFLSSADTTPPPLLCVRQDRLRHSQWSSEGVKPSNKIIEHEVVTLQVEGSPQALEIRLRCDMEERSGMAVVTHLTEPRLDLQLDLRQVRELQDLYYKESCARDTSSAVPGHCDPSLAMLCLVLPPNEENTMGYGIENAMKSYLLSLATPYGPDRREIRMTDLGRVNGNGDRSKNSQSPIPESERHMRRLDLLRSKQVLKDRILQASRLAETLPVSGSHLLVWILHESPSVVESSCPADVLSAWDTDIDVERTLLALPIQLLEDEAVKEAIQRNWACRGQALVMLINWRLGRLTFLDILGQAKVSEMLDIASMMGYGRGRE